MPRPLGLPNPNAGRKPGFKNPNAGRKKGVITEAMKNAGRKSVDIDEELSKRVIELRKQGKSKHEITLETKLSYYFISKILANTI